MSRGLPPTRTNQKKRRAVIKPLKVVESVRISSIHSVYSTESESLSRPFFNSCNNFTTRMILMSGSQWGGGGGGIALTVEG